MMAQNPKALDESDNEKSHLPENVRKSIINLHHRLRREIKFSALR